MILVDICINFFSSKMRFKELLFCFSMTFKYILLDSIGRKSSAINSNKINFCYYINISTSVFDLVTILYFFSQSPTFFCSFIFSLLTVFPQFPFLVCMYGCIIYQKQAVTEVVPSSGWAFSGDYLMECLNFDCQLKLLINSIKVTSTLK